MLSGKNLSGSHYARLIAVIYGHKHTEQRHYGLAATHITLQKAVHLTRPTYISTYLTEYTFLRIGEVKGQTLLVESVEIVPYSVERMSHSFAAELVCLPQNGKLNVEELLKFEACQSLVKRGHILREMGGYKRLRRIWEMILIYNMQRQSLFNLLAVNVFKYPLAFIHSITEKTAVIKAGMTAYPALICPSPLSTMIPMAMV